MRRAKCCESAVSRYSENRWEQMGAIVFESGREYLGGSDCTIFYIADTSPLRLYCLYQVRAKKLRLTRFETAVRGADCRSWCGAWAWRQHSALGPRPGHAGPLCHL